MRHKVTLMVSTIAVSLMPVAAAAQGMPRGTETVRVKALTSFSMKPKEVRDLLDNALMKDPNSVQLNFLSGLVYDAQSAAGSEGRQLARVGYLTALRADPTYWPANYQLGLLAMEDGDALSAQRHFIGAGFYATEVPMVFYALARAAYCTGDKASAMLALNRAMELTAPTYANEYETAALVYAANGDRAAAESWVEKLEAATGKPAARQLRSRVSALLQPAPAPAWPAITATAPAMAAPAAPAVAAPRRPALPKGGATPAAGSAQMALQGATPPVPGAPPASASPSQAGSTAAPAPQSPAASGRRKMATVDVVIIRRKEARAVTTGINLMDALSLQFGSTLVNSERSRTVDRLAGSTSADIVNTINNVNLTVPTVTYSLNIANAAGNKSSIDARPTLLVYDGQTAKVFSGGTLTYAASGQLSSQSYTKEVGLSLTVTPTFNDDGTVTLAISTALETFINTEAAGSFREAVQTDKSSTEITADLRFGDTVIVSAGRFNNFQVGRDGTPVLGDIPVIGNLFKQASSSYESNDLLVLLSLRRETGGSDSGSAEEASRVDLLGDRLWTKLGLTPPNHATRIAPEDYRSSYILDNPGRGFNKAYIELIGLTDMFIS